MTTTSRPTTAIADLHHVGLIVRRIGKARETFTRLGFVVPPATFPAFPTAPGERPRAFGAGNTHIEFGTNFVELVAVLDESLDSPAAVEAGSDHEELRLQVIDAPESARAQLTQAIAATTARLRAALDRHEGLHILAFYASDAQLAAGYLDSAGIRHSGVQRLQRQTETADGRLNEPVSFLELDDPGNTPEGRLAIAESVPSDVERFPDHPNGAYGLTEVYIAVPDDELLLHAERYGRYLNRAAHRDGQALVFNLDRSRVVLVPTWAVPEILPGEQANADGPGLVAYTVKVRDLGVTSDYLGTREVAFRRLRERVLVPATIAHGAALVFEQGAGG